MANKVNIRTYSPTSNDKFIIDTNIWINLLEAFSMKCNKSIIDTYSDFINTVLDNQSEIKILYSGISELFNKYIKIGFKNYIDIQKIQGNHKHFDLKKDYRPTTQYDADKKFIITQIDEQILIMASPENDNFNNIDINKLLNKRDREFDLNDRYFALFCEKYNYKLITHDRDFIKNYPDLNFDVITML